MKILLTGGSGFIGNYFHKEYKNTHEISTFSFRDDDINRLDLNDIDTIVHLSALVHQMGGASREEYFQVNVENTLSLAKKAKQSGVKQFIFMSSVKVYGEENEIPYSENSKCKPQDDYGKSKLEAENQLRELGDEKFVITILRTPIVYGYGVKANIKNLIKLIDRVAIIPFNGIKNRRSMVYIGNLTTMIFRLCETRLSGTFLAADDRSISTTELIELISKESNRKIYLVKIPFFKTLLRLLKPSYYKRLYENLEVDNSTSMRRLNIQNPYSVEQGIHFMIHKEKT